MHWKTLDWHSKCSDRRCMPVKSKGTAALARYIFSLASGELILSWEMVASVMGAWLAWQAGPFSVRTAATPDVDVGWSVKIAPGK